MPLDPRRSALPPRPRDDPTGRGPARPDRRSGNSRRKISALAMLVGAVLVIAPLGALVKLSAFVDWRGVAGYTSLISLLTWFLYRKDKQQAELGGRRTPESTLHALEVFGGWPAAFLAQRWYRHKIAKRIYQVNFWAIVLLHQCLAMEYLQEWRWSRAALLRLDAALK